MRGGPNSGGLSRKAILAEVEHSLRRLGTDYIDLYQITGGTARRRWRRRCRRWMPCWHDDTRPPAVVKVLGSA